MHFSKAPPPSLSLSLSLSLFISAMLVGERVSWRIGLSRSADVRSSGARKIAEFIDRAIARKICIRARCIRPDRSRLSARTRMRLHRVCTLSVINTQLDGRLNAGSAPAPGPIIIRGIVRVGPISRTAVDRGRQNHFAESSSPRCLHFPFAFRLFARFRRGSFAALTSFPG